MSITAAVIGGLVSVGINYWNKKDQEKANRIASAQQANNAIRQYNETGRQKQVATRLFEGEMANSYGNDFLSSLQGGKDTASLLSDLSKGDTAFSKQLQGYDADARQAMENSVTANRNTGTLANLQGQQNALGMRQMGIQSTQAQGAAISSQATSGIRSDAGTGSNAQIMQEQANDLALQSMQKQIEYGNVSTRLQMEGTQTSASQSAAQLRRQADLTAREVMENALNKFANYQAGQEDAESSMQNYKKDVDYFKVEAGKESGRIDETMLKFEDD